MLIALAGLPATGKSTLARPLAERLNAVVLDKDHIRAALFRPEDIDYTREQTDLCVNIMFEVASYLLKKNPHRCVILDGRPFSKRYQVEALRRFAADIQAPLIVIECVISDEVAHARLQEAVAQQNHLAANRNYDLYRRLKAEADAIDEPKLVIDTGAIPLERCIELALDYIRKNT